MHDCCDIYSLSFTNSDRHDCSVECLSDDASECCYDYCYSKASGIYDVAKNVVKYESFVKATTVNYTVDEELIDIAKKSVENCTKEVKKNGEGLLLAEVCDMKYELYLVSKCVLKTNYMNCPNVTATEECKALIKNVDCKEDYKKLLEAYQKKANA